MNEQEFIDQLKRHEGYRGEVYEDTEGVLTCGWGHALYKGSHMPHFINELFLDSDLFRVKLDYASLGYQLDSVREYVIKNMLFNLGLRRFLTFSKMISALWNKDWNRAANEMMDSKWAGQVKGRAAELADMMLTGEYKGNQ